MGCPTCAVKKGLALQPDLVYVRALPRFLAPHPPPGSQFLLPRSVGGRVSHTGYERGLGEMGCGPRGLLCKLQSPRWGMPPAGHAGRTATATPAREEGCWEKQRPRAPLKHLGRSPASGWVSGTVAGGSGAGT